MRPKDADLFGERMKKRPVDYNFQPKGLKSDLGWYDRGYIPDFEGGEIPQFLTFRLSDSLPKKVVQKLLEEMDSSDAAYRKRIEGYLDRGYGECYLGLQEVAEMVAESLRKFHGKKYRLHAWVIMPNHVHVLLTPLNGIELNQILHSIKSFTAHEANRMLKRTGQFWQHESFDRYIRNQEHFFNVIEYIEQNPVEAGLCEVACQWRYSSAFSPAC